MQDQILKAAAEAAIQRRDAAEATATPDERIAIQHAKAAKAKELRKQEVASNFFMASRQIQLSCMSSWELAFAAWVCINYT